MFKFSTVFNMMFNYSAKRRDGHERGGPNANDGSKKTKVKSQIVGNL